ncbi:DUF1648 domain-containing protein [Halobaculum sp. MBLA0147]|uniref:DUF1648 domain-containing protein n=1 Tax=Halobaculum sp. MBLA0147 TaxID=3079934 RepID=UPI003523CBD3
MNLRSLLTVRAATLPSVALVAAAALAGLLAWPALPAEMAIHFNGGTPDNFVPRWQGVFAAPALGLAAVLFTRAVGDSSGDPAVTAVAMLFTGVVIAYVQALVLLWNLGVRLDPTTAVLPVLVAAGVLVWFKYRGRALPTAD